MVVFAIACCQGNSLQYTHINEKETLGARCVASLHNECQGLKPKGESHISFLILHPSSDEDIVNTAGCHLKRRMA